MPKVKKSDMREPHTLHKTDGVEIVMGDCERDEIEIFIVADKLVGEDEFLLRFFGYYEFEREDDDAERLVGWDWCVHVKSHDMKDAIKGAKAKTKAKEEPKEEAKEGGDASSS